jgi:trans-AT polyketide synthase/acyltransferase/oxidoreductase domain-containing protein
MGAFNRWVKGTELESWRNRHVGDIATRLMHSTAAHLSERLRLMSST